MKKSYPVLKSLLMILILIQSTKSFAQCTCTGTFINEQFTGGFNPTNIPNVQNGNGLLPAGTYACQQNNGNITIAGGGCNFNSVRGGEIDRVWRPIATLSNTWTADFTLTINATPPGGSANYYPAVHLLIFSANNLPLNTNANIGGAQLCNGASGFGNTNNSAIWVDLVSNAPPGCNGTATPGTGGNQTLSAWRFNAHARLNNGAVSNSGNINCTGIGTYFIRLQRTWSNWGALYVYSDPTFTTLIGSTCFAIDPGIQNLSVEQHSVADGGSCDRTFNGTVRNLRVCNSVTCPTALNPTITGNSVFCDGSQITVTGSAGSNPGPVLNSIWTITECNSSCNILTPVSSYTTGWFAGGPGSFNFTNVILDCGHGCTEPLQCGHWYLIELAVQNCGNPWATTTKCIYIDCLPIADAGPDKIICTSTSSSTTIGGTNTSAGCSYSWLPTTGLTCPSCSTTVASPTVTTTYTLTVTSGNNCIATDVMTVIVDNLTADAGIDYSFNCNTSPYVMGGTPNGTGPVAIGGTGPFSYSWSPNPLNLLNSTTIEHPTYTIAVGQCINTNYTVTVTDANGCQASDVVNISCVCPRLANPDLDSVTGPSAMSIAPNPTNGNFIATFRNPEAMHDIEIVDISGKIVYQKSGVTDHTLQINISDQPKGVYLVKCKEGDQQFVQRIVLQ